MKSLPRIVLAVYILLLLWLVLFKFSFDFWGVVAYFQHRGLNLIPFAGISRGTVREMIENFVVFLPFGLLLSASFKRVQLWRKLAVIGAVSVGVETLQYILAIGLTDITDVIMNTLGGLAGLLLYRWLSKHVPEEKLDSAIAVTVVVLLALTLYARLFVFRVRY
jgi:glycopeptide antibiotics resistance protein